MIPFNLGEGFEPFNPTMVPIRIGSPSVAATGPERTPDVLFGLHYFTCYNRKQIPVPPQLCVLQKMVEPLW